MLVFVDFIRCAKSYREAAATDDRRHCGSRQKELSKQLLVAVSLGRSDKKMTLVCALIIAMRALISDIRQNENCFYVSIK